MEQPEVKTPEDWVRLEEELENPVISFAHSRI
jgi:hypothetical protein